MSDEPAPGRPVRMREVADVAGVSTMTVSRALFQPERVSPGVRERVARAVRETGYSPNRLAGGLKSRRSRSVACVVPHVVNSIFASMTQSLSEVLDREGFQLILGSTDYPTIQDDAYVARLLEYRPQGLIIAGLLHDSPSADLLRRAAVRVVEVWDLVPAPIDMVVGFSNERAGLLITRHVLDRGYRRLVFAGLDGPFDRRAQARKRGFTAAVREVPGARAAYIDGVFSPRPLARDGADLMARILRGKRGAEAVVFTNEIMAIGGIMQCWRDGVRVPDDIAIAGIGDSELAETIHPTLSTVRLPTEEVGRRAALLLVETLRGDGPAAPVVELDVALRPRAST